MPVTNLTAVVASRIRDKRRALGLTQAALAESAEVSTELVSRIERSRCLPSVLTLIAFAKALHTSPNELLGYEQPKRARELDDLMAVMRSLPTARRREVHRIAEALARYERRR